jgi:hypothetical protein
MMIRKIYMFGKVGRKREKKEKRGRKYTWATGWLVERVEDGREGYMVLTGRAQEGR